MPLESVVFIQLYVHSLHQNGENKVPVWHTHSRLVENEHKAVIRPGNRTDAPSDQRPSSYVLQTAKSTECVLSFVK